MCILHAFAFHFTTWLDAEVSEMAGAFAISTDNLAAKAVKGT